MKRVAGIVALAGVILLAWMLLPKPATNGGVALATGLYALVAIVAGMLLAGHAGLVFFYAGRLALIVAAYVGAALVASTFLWFTGVVGSASDASAGELPLLLAGAVLFAVYPISFIVLAVGYHTVVPAAATILVAEILGVRGWLFYAIAGAAIGLVATELYIQPSAEGAAGPGLGFRATVVGGGIAAGLAYWLAAGRLAGNWRARSWARLGGAPG